MSYNDCKQALFNSSAIGDIPDNWYRDMPVIFIFDNIVYVGFLFWKYAKETVTLKRMISVNTSTNELKVFSSEQMSKMFDFERFTVKALTIEDREKYISVGKEYEQIIGHIIDNPTDDYSKLSNIAKQLFSEEQYESIIQKIGSTFYF